MRPTIWLASYPKSGNTWFRLLMANINAGSKEPVAINRVDSTDSIASGRARFDNETLVESGLLDHDAVDRLRPALYAHLARPNAPIDAFDPESSYPVRFVKTHDGYTRLPGGAPMMGGAAAAAGAILIVRDPRDVACSFANHLRCDTDFAIQRMGDPDFNLCDLPTMQTNQLRQRLLGWSGFVASWLDQTDIPVHLLRYEDMHARPVETVRAALDFVGWPVDTATIATAVANAAMPELQRQEAENGFAEAPNKVRFFRKGVTGGWRDELTDDQVHRIEQDHLSMMRHMGYAPAMMSKNPPEDQGK